MLGNDHFYNRTIRKVVVAFGTIFNDIVLVRQTSGGANRERFKVPLSYGAKEKYITRITSDPTMFKSIATIVPRISFNLDGLSYDASRKQLTTLQNFSISQSGGFNRQYLPVPYNFDFSMSIYVRNTEDGAQILEQILPFFTPDFTVTVDFVSAMGIKYDMPIILNSVSSTVDYEGDMMTTRLVIWDLNFTAKGFIWPAVKQNSSGLIGAAYTDLSGNTAYGKITTNIYVETERKDVQKAYVDYANGSNYFSDSELISVEGKDTKGRVLYFSNNESGILLVGDLNDTLKIDDIVIGSYTNAKYRVSNLDSTPQKVVTIVTTANPLGSGPEDDYGFTDTIEEWPNNLT